ncbi:MAG: tetratricopeptide repeat protein [Actinomycetota bacterium]|nr:tetratricopeptide repeat protein [Actinomycetota bacterium]
MSNQPGGAGRLSLDLRGAVDLGALAASRPPAPTAAGGPAPGTPAGSAGALVVDITDANFVAEVVNRSDEVPVVVDFWATWCGPCKTLSPVLEKLAEEFGGRFLLAKVEVDANPQLKAAFQIQSVPSVFAVLRGQPVPLFQGAQPEAQIRQVLTELLRVAQANGVTGRIAVEEMPAEDAQEVEPEPLPPLHQAAYDAIDRGDFAAAVAAYEQALKEAPADDTARVGLAQVRLLQRTHDVDAAVARRTAAGAPQDVAAQILVADLDVLGGHIKDAFSRMIDTVRVTSGPEREQAREHLVELFDVVGAEDDRVRAARLALANALF